MPATVTKTLIVGMDGYEYTLGDKQSQQRADVWTMAKHFGVDEENETLMYIGVVREMVSRYSFSHVQDYETFGDDAPRTLRQWHRAYMRRFENELPLWLQLAMRSARKQRV